MNLAGFLGALLAAVVGGSLFWMAWKRDFFRLPSELWRSGVALWHVFAAFGLYIAIFFAVVRLLAPRLHLASINPVPAPIRIAAILHFLIYALLLIAFYLLVKKCRLNLWRGSTYPLMHNLKTAFFAALISYPLVLAVQQFLDLFMRALFQLPALPEQIAVYFLKMTLADPFYFLLALFTVIILAPCAEETLFRGFLQSYLRQKLGSKYAILCTALLFACFHFAIGQGASNLPILTALFLFALFLGFLYEKEQSLRAPIALHMLFNSINALELYLWMRATPAQVL